MNEQQRQWTFRLKKSVHPKVVDFCNKQSSITDSLLYLIEKEIAENGVRNLQEHIPSVRNILGSVEKIKKVTEVQTEIVKKSLEEFSVKQEEQVLRKVKEDIKEKEIESAKDEIDSDDEEVIPSEYY